ncbi:MAG: pyrimidine-nucleoside phosphorylase, partial [Lachnospiraceae bacterium]|nr:pyrimidine-nucleoside phosphorylase [Lachnospiraceae bacterium]
FIEAQGGDKELVYHTDGLPKASIIEEIASPADGYIQRIVCDEIGICSLILGGGRETKESEIDLSVGLVLHKKVGDYVKQGESLATIHANDREKLNAAKERFLSAYTINDTSVTKKPLIRGIVTR